MNAILRRLCQIPTAPFCEHRVMKWIEQWAGRNGLTARTDRFGNLLVEARPGRPRWVFVGHMDHPGLCAIEEPSPQLLRASFRGHVQASHLHRTPVIFYAGRKSVRGTIVSAKADDHGTAIEVMARMEGSVPTGAVGMFDLEVSQTTGDIFRSRAIDDIAGVAAILQALLNNRQSAEGPGLAALLTRGEEEGFIGAIAAAKDRKLLQKTDRLISIETSAMQPYAPQGKGVVIRVGDKSSVFDSAMTYQLTQIAQTLAKGKKRFAFQRALMPGGTCEATAFGAFGYRAAALCIPLGNYHNMVPGKKKIAAEFIDLNDWQSLVTLLTEVGKSSIAGDLAILRKRLTDRFRELKDRLA